MLTHAAWGKSRLICMDWAKRTRQLWRTWTVFLSQRHRRFLVSRESCFCDFDGSSSEYIRCYWVASTKKFRSRTRKMKKLWRCFKRRHVIGSEVICTNFLSFLGLILCSSIVGMASSVIFVCSHRPKTKELLEFLLLLFLLLFLFTIWFISSLKEI